jgi:hypothetical protein
MADEADPKEVIFELVRLGALVRVSAIDPASLTEVVLRGPAAAGEVAPRRPARARLCPRAHESAAAARERTCRPLTHALELAGSSRIGPKPERGLQRCSISCNS